MNHITSADLVKVIMAFSNALNYAHHILNMILTPYDLDKLWILNKREKIKNPPH